ncbi:hypothetical protein EYF80_019768 [Liparis tanakae]|uniref:Uncharacterized protein n=1 Tax=Liparis tanakae TaxID=230148 RepID=A0A4Z2HYS4_9TELE|nr:hypothetical protein EYF80_019768 [Liparis tanakae]
MATSGFPSACTSRSRAACSLRLTLWYALLALSSCGGTTTKRIIYGGEWMRSQNILRGNARTPNPAFESETLQTFFSRLAHGFWARVKPVSMSWDSLKPPNTFLWKVSFCQVRTRSPSSATRERQMEACKEASRSAVDRKHCHAFRMEPYSGPGAGEHRHSNVKCQISKKSSCLQRNDRQPPERALQDHVDEQRPANASDATGGGQNYRKAEMKEGRRERQRRF